MTQSSQLGVVSVQQGPDGCEQGPAPPRTERAPWRKKWQPTPVFLPREPHGQKNLGAYDP